MEMQDLHTLWPQEVVKARPLVTLIRLFKYLSLFQYFYSHIEADYFYNR